jgi:hypothetical protein
VALVGCGDSSLPPQAPARTAVEAMVRRGGGPRVVATADNAVDSRLRPRHVQQPIEVVEASVVEALQRSVGWHVGGPVDHVIWGTRRTAVLGFVEDVYILVEPTSHMVTTLHAVSVARQGVGASGRNLRNLAELWRAVESARPGH